MKHESGAVSAPPSRRKRPRRSRDRTSTLQSIVSLPVSTAKTAATAIAEAMDDGSAEFGVWGAFPGWTLAASILVIGPLSISFWRGTWVLFDVYMFPIEGVSPEKAHENLATTAWWSLALGAVLIVFSYIVSFRFRDREAKADEESDAQTKNGRSAPDAAEQPDTDLPDSASMRKGSRKVPKRRGSASSMPPETTPAPFVLVSPPSQNLRSVIENNKSKRTESSDDPPIDVPEVVIGIDGQWTTESTSSSSSSSSSSSRSSSRKRRKTSPKSVHSQSLESRDDGRKRLSVPSKHRSNGSDRQKTSTIVSFEKHENDPEERKTPPETPRKRSKAHVVFRAVFDRVILYIAGIGAVLSWRGIWYMWDYYILPSDYTLSGWISHLVGTVGLISLMALKSILAPPAMTIGDVDNRPAALTFEDLVHFDKTWVERVFGHLRRTNGCNGSETPVKRTQSSPPVLSAEKRRMEKRRVEKRRVEKRREEKRRQGERGEKETV